MKRAQYLYIFSLLVLFVCLVVLHGRFLDVVEIEPRFEDRFTGKARIASFELESLRGCSSRVNAYFDAVFVLNLDRYFERWLQSEAILKRLGICAMRKAAVDGMDPRVQTAFEEYTKLGLETEWEKQVGRKAIISSGAFANLFSFVEMIRYAQNNFYRRILVLEDDFLPISGLERRFENLTQSLAEASLDDWVVLYLGASQFTWKSVAERPDPFYLTPGVYGGFAIGFDSRIFQELLDEAELLRGAFDVGAVPTACRLHQNQCVVASPNLFIASLTERSLTSLQKKNVSGLATTFRWDLSLYVPRIAVPVSYERISVIVPVCGENEMVRNVAEHFLQNTYPDFEIVLVSHCLCNETDAIGRELESLHSRIRFHSIGETSVEMARTVGVSRSSGSIVAFSLVAYSLSSRLWRQAEPILSNRALLSSVQMAFVDDEILVNDGDSALVRALRTHAKRETCSVAQVLSSIMFSRRVMEFIGPFDDLGLVGDSEWTEKLIRMFSHPAGNDETDSTDDLVLEVLCSSSGVSGIIENVAEVLVVRT